MSFFDSINFFNSIVSKGSDNFETDKYNFEANKEINIGLDNSDFNNKIVILSISLVVEDENLINICDYINNVSFIRNNKILATLDQDYIYIDFKLNKNIKEKNELILNFKIYNLIFDSELELKFMPNKTFKGFIKVYYRQKHCFEPTPKICDIIYNNNIHISEKNMRINLKPVNKDNLIKSFKYIYIKSSTDDFKYSFSFPDKNISSNVKSTETIEKNTQSILFNKPIDITKLDVFEIDITTKTDITSNNITTINIFTICSERNLSLN